MVKNVKLKIKDIDQKFANSNKQLKIYAIKTSRMH